MKQFLLIIGVVLAAALADSITAQEHPNRPVQTDISVINSSCSNTDAYQCRVRDDGCIIAYCISDEHAQNPTPWFIHCPAGGKDT